MYKFFTIALIFTSLFLTAQTTSDFEEFNLSSETFLNGSDGNGGFSSGNIFLPNSYEDTFGSWTGWSISNTTDVTTPGYTNQYSAITGEGAENSATYATGYTAGGRMNVVLEDAAAGENVSGFYITNSTYAYLSMKDGDGFAKKFGGATGDDPDYFLLTIKKYENDELSMDSVNVYLADYRFEDNTEDYILNEWSYVDLTSLGSADSLQFFLTSTDNGAFGMNTPAYFCIDNFTTTDGITAVENASKEEGFTLSPNPVSDFLFIKSKEEGEASYRIFDQYGRLVNAGTFTNEKRIDTSFLRGGMYFVKIGKEETQMFVKS